MKHQSYIMQRQFEVDRVVEGGKHYYRLGDSSMMRPGLTGILGSVIPKPLLMPWGMKIMGEYIAQFLKKIATKRLLKTKRINTLIKRAKRQARYEKEKAGILGTDAHRLFDDLGESPTFDTEDIVLQNFFTWRDKTKLSIFDSEVMAGSMKMDYGCTVDALCHKQDGKIEIVEYKTSKSIHNDHAYQVAGQSLAVRETFGLDYYPSGRVVRFDKYKEGYEQRLVDNMEDTIIGFLHILKLYPEYKRNKWRTY